VTKVAENFIELSKAGTLKRVINLPQEDGIDTVKSIRGVFWSGYSKYTGNYRGNLTFNIDRPWTEPVLAQIMTHEAYPGHQAFYCRWDYFYMTHHIPLLPLLMLLVPLQVLRLIHLRMLNRINITHS
jgi:hypothetical protein